jgi:uncharacterized protein YpuA (DUF1002 family)
LKLAELDEKVREFANEKLFYLEKLSSYELKEGKEPRERTNNLMKLRREIAKQKVIDNAPPSEQLKHQLQTAQTELQILKDSLLRSESLRKQA